MARHPPPPCLPQDDFFSATFTDPDGLLPLSMKQRSYLRGWERPRQYMRHPTMIADVNPFTITQRLVTDCSFVASLCIAAAFEKKTKKKLVTSIIYPQVWTHVQHEMLEYSPQRC